MIGGVVQSGGIEVLYGGTGYTTGATVQAVDVPPGQRTITMTGILTSNVTYILANGNFNNASRRPEFVNNTTGAFTITVKISNGAGGSTGTGVVLPQGTNNSTALTLLTDGSTDVWIADTPLGIGAIPAGGGGVINNTPIGPTTPSTGAFTTLSATGNFTPSQTNGIVGTTTNNNANAGSVGEILTASTSTTATSSGVPMNATSVSLTAGDWDVTGIAQFNPAGTTVTTSALAGINTVSATFGTVAAGINNFTLVAGLSGNAGVANNVVAPVTRISIASTTTVFLVAQVGFTTSTMTTSGFIRARRVR